MNISIKHATLSMLLLTLVACSKLTAENYKKIEMGMPYDEIVKLLGEPDKCEVLLSAKTCTWGNEEKHIEVQMIANKVVLYSAVGLE